MAASLGLINPEAFFNPCSSYSASPFMAADYMPSFPGSADAAAFSTELDDHPRFDHFDYSPASIFADVGGGDEHNEKKMYVLN